MKKGFILGFLTAILFYIVVNITIPVINFVINSETIAFEAFNVIGDPELKMTIETEESIDLSLLNQASAGEIARFFAQGNGEKEEQYLAVLESGLRVEITVKHHDGASTSYNSIYYPRREIGGMMKTYSAHSNVVITRDSESMSEEELLKQIVIELGEPLNAEAVSEH